MTSPTLASTGCGAKAKFLIVTVWLAVAPAGAAAHPPAAPPLAPPEADVEATADPAAADPAGADAPTGVAAAGVEPPLPEQAATASSAARVGTSARRRMGWTSSEAGRPGCRVGRSVHRTGVPRVLDVDRYRSADDRPASSRPRGSAGTTVGACARRRPLAHVARGLLPRVDRSGGP